MNTLNFIFSINKKEEIIELRFLKTSCMGNFHTIEFEREKQI